MKHPVSGWFTGKNTRLASLWVWLGTYASLTISIRICRYSRTINIGRHW